MKKTIRLSNLLGLMRIDRRRRHWMLAITISVMMLILPSAFSVSAATVSVNVNGNSLYSSQDLLKSGVTYVPLRAFADAVYDDFEISWNASTRTATVQDGSYVLKARVNDRYITVNGQKITSTVPNLLIQNRIHVPVRSICTAMGLDVGWNGSRRLVSVNGSYDASNEAQPPVTGNPDDSPNNSDNINSEDLYWLSRIIHAESSGEPMTGKIAVGTVVMNRVNSSMYPDTVYGVIFDKKHGTQFTPVASGTIYNDPSSESVEAARRVLKGERTDSRILFFVNEKLAPDNWISKNRTYIMTIGNHKFYA